METAQSSVRIPQRGGYNREVEWYLTEVSRLMGERSNFAGLVAVIERGGTGGNSGTKGCGMIRIEPFENRADLADVHRDFRRAAACQSAWGMLSTRSRWLLSARYCYSKEKLPPGLHEQLGALSAVAFVVVAFSDEANRFDAKRKNQVDRLLTGASKRNSLKWAEELAANALTEAHGAWEFYRAHVGVARAAGGTR